MKRCLLTALVLGTSLGTARADYVIILANLGQSKEQPGQANGGPQGGGPSMPGKPGGGFGPGGMGSPAPGGGMGSPAPGGGMGSPPPGGGFRPGAGGAGMPGMPGMQGGMPGMPGMAGGAGFRGGAGPGAAGGRPGAPMMPPGMTGMGGMPGMIGANLGAANSEGTPLLTYAIVEINHSQTNARKLNADRFIKVTTPWGASIVRKETQMTIAHIVEEPVGPGRHIDETFRRLEKDNETASINEWIGLAHYALEHGKISELPRIMEKAEQKDKAHPAVVAFRKVEGPLKTPASRGDESAFWKQKLQGQYEVAQSEHYALLHNKEKAPFPLVKERLHLLEENLQSFYYWFALRGKALPVPDGRLVAVLVLDSGDFDQKHKLFDSKDIVADGFYDQRDNLAFLSQTRLDTPSLALTQRNQELWSKFSFDDMLKGTTAVKDRDTRHLYDANTIAAVHTVALLQKTQDTDGQRTAISHDGTRQLIVAAGLVPRGVEVPQWLDFGMASFFETPKGRPWTGPGVASWTYLPLAKDEVKGKNAEKPLDLLKGVITDRHFALLTKTKDKTD
jgi:hypothetical protein